MSFDAKPLPMPAHGRRRTLLSLAAGAAAAIGASACCAGPLALVLLGVGGSWASSLVALQPLQPYFVAAALAAFGFAFHRLYLRRMVCEPDQLCATTAVRRRQRVLFWLVLLPAATLMALPLYAPLFY